MLKHLTLATSVLLLAAAGASAQSYFGLQQNLLTDQNAITESWNNLTPANYPTYPGGYSGNKIPNTIANISPTVINPATLIHVNGGAASGQTGGPSPAFIFSRDGHFGIYNSSPAANGLPTSQYRIQKDSVLNDLQTVAFLLESSPYTDGSYFKVAPVLIINGDVFAADFVSIAAEGIISGGTTTVAQNYFQWDLSGYTDPITSFAIEFTVAPHALILGLQVSQSDVHYNAAAIPEPSTYALIGAGLAGAALLRRRRQTT